jgi:5-methyltetrahydrofolate--homocysteine methyltransferase
MGIFEELRDLVIKGEEDELKALVQKSLDEGIEAARILDEGLAVGMQIVGEKMNTYEMDLIEVLVSAEAMQASMELLRPLLVKGDKFKKGAKVAVGTVKGDVHDIGKNLVCMLLSGSGYEVLDLGKDVPPEKFIEAVKSEGVTVVGMSALVTTTIPNLSATIEALKKAGLRDKVKIMVGGACVYEEYAKKIGADGYGAKASDAVQLVKQFST